MIPKTIKTSEAAKRCHLNQRTIQKAAKAGNIKSWKIGNRYLLCPDSLEAWFNGQEVRPVKRVGRPRKGARR